ncbi:VP13D-like protein [Mya arenaria]|uniref:VP13D-like protein n=1 Tax=Mya arenaria TaxID=6604 RepID=A0ABY7EJY7_MYAAR|nr:VP13D-like protein [Mya arenaria]
MRHSFLTQTQVGGVNDNYIFDRRRQSKAGMLEGLAAWVLNTYVGEYVENLNTDQLSIALLSGAVELENLPLKKDALSKLGLPLQVKSERLYLVAGPLLEYKYDEEKEKAATEARKTQMLKALEDKMQIQKTYTGSSWFSYGTSVLANILENLQLNVSDVHLRYEDAITNPSCPFACGIVIKSLTAQSTDDSWTPKFVSRSVVDLMHKLVDLRDFSIYVDTNTTLVGDLPRDKMADHEYILSPVSASAKMKRHTTALPLRNLATPRNAIDLTLENMAFSVSEDQYRNIVLLLREFDQYEQSKRYRKWRPQCQLHKKCKDVVAYVKLYTAYMKKEFLDATMKSPSPEPEKPKAKPQSVALTTTPSPPLEDKSILQRWFPGWGGWYGGQVQAPVQASSDVGTSRVLVQGSQDDSAGEPPPPKISKSELEQELEVVIDDVLGDGEDDKSILKRDFVFAQLNFCLKTGSLRVLGNSTNTSTEDRLSHSIMELECSAIKMLFESRPRNSGLTFGLSVGGLQLLDKMTEGTLFPVLIGCQNKERFGNKGYGGFQRGAGFTAVHEETDRKLFELKYEKNPLGTSANYRFSIHSEPLDIVYNKPAFKKVKEVFSSRNIHKAKKSAPTLSDEFLTPMSTPPNELEEDKAQTATNLDTLSQLELTEEQFYSKLYENYTLELRDLQIMSGRMKDNWRHIHNRTTTPLHLLDRLSISLQLERRLIYTTDPQYPTVIASGEMPVLTLHVNEHKVQIINSCIASLSKVPHTPPVPNSMSLSMDSQVSLSASTSGLSLSEIGEMARDESIDVDEGGEDASVKLKELLEESKLLLVQFNINRVSLEIHSRDRPIAELQVCNVKSSLTKRLYDTSVSLTVHSLLVVDAIQTYGKDFELLMASHRNVSLDSTSGSIRDSAPTSPMAVSPPGSPMEHLPGIQEHPSGGLAAMHDVVSRAFQALISSDDCEPKVKKSEDRSHMMSPVLDSEALITVEYEMYAANSPSNKNNKATSQTEVTAEFNRLSILLMRLEDGPERVSARKVATATMSAARLQATIDTRMTMSGSLGGFHVFDITPEAKRHQRVFSVGQDMSQSHIPHHVFVAPTLYQTANESVLDDLRDNSSKAFSFEFSKPLKNKSSRSCSPIFNRTSDDLKGDNCISVNLRVASLCYTHSPKCLQELSLCVSAFKEYKASVAKSLKSVASEVAKGIIAKRSEMSHPGNFGSGTSLDTIAKLRSNLSLDNTEMEYLENATILEDTEVQKNKIMIDASFDSPVIVIPKSASSSRVFVAHLGQISLSNKDDKAQIQFEDEKPVEDLIDKEEANPDRIFVEIRKMNLYSVDIDQKNEEKGKGAMGFDGPSAFRPVHVDTDKDTPIMYDTTVHVTIDHVSGDTLSGASNVDNLGDESFFPKDIESSFSQQDTQQPVMDIRAKIQTPLKLVLLKSVYEQILQTSDYLSSEKEANPDTPDSVKDAFDNKSDIVGGITDDTGGLESSKVSANSVSQGKLPFISKKLRFEVPLFNVEMRANLSDGEQGVVDIRLNRFLLDLTKDNPATTNVELSLKSIVMEDLLEAKDSPHRIIVMSKGPQREDPRHMKPHEFLSHSCPDNAIITPEPVMPGSLPSSFHSHLTHMNKPIMSRPLAGAFVSQRFNLDSDNKKNPRTPPPLVHMLRWASDDSLVDEHLVHISLVLVDVASPEFKEKYNEIKRFVDVDFSCLEVKINLQTWVVLLDFLGLGAKVADIDVLSGREPEVQSKPNDSDEYVQAVVNSEIKLGKVSLLDLSPSGALYRERFMTVGEQALEFDFFKYGMPDPWCKRDYDMKLKMEMSSVRYTHTQRFAMEMLGFVQHFLQAQDVLGRIRAASAGKKINEAAFHQARLLLDIVAGSPIILIPHSSKSTDVLVADLGQLSVRNCFKLDGNDGTCTADQQTSTQKPVSAEPESAGGLLLRQPLSRSSSRTTQRSVSSTSVGSEAKNVDPMQQSLYGSLEHDMRIENSDESMDISEIGSSVDPQSPAPSAIGSQISLDPFSSRSRTSVSARSDSSGLDLMSVPDNSSPAPDTKKSGLNVFLSEAFNTKLFTTNPDTNEFIDEPSSLSDTTMKDNSNMTASSMTSQDEDKTMDTDAGPCLLDVMDVRLSAMDLFSAERVDKSRYSGTNLRQDLEFPSCVIQRKGYALLKEKCMLDLKIERNLDGDQSHAVPDVRVQGALSSVYCCLDVTQYKLIRGLLDHNLGEKIENFKKELLTYMQDPSIQTVLSGDVWTVISMGVDLHNVTLEFVTSHDLDPTDPSMSGVSLAKLDFIHSRLSYESFSDQSKETDLTSTEILISDTRFRDVATNQRTSVFEKILQPMKSESGRRLQLELHWRASQEGTTFSVVVNNMKLLCSFEWIMAVKEFIATKPENPFLYGQSLSNMSCASRSGATSPVTVSSVGSGATSPLSSTSMTSNTQQAQSDPPFELKLNVTETEFVVVENLSSLDTNAVILRCTAVLSYRPQSKDKILSCTLQSLEVFSCSLQAEEETALSIVDPVTIQVTMERNRNYTPVLRHSPMELGLSDTRVFGDKHLLLEVTLDDTMNVRLSYQDMQLFLAIWESLPKTLKSKPSAQSPTAVPSEYNIDKLEELGFSHSECANALETHNNNLNEAAYWLIENSKSSKQKKGEKKVTTIEVSVKTLCLCLIDDCLDADIPLVEMTFSGISLKFEPGNEGRARFGVMADYYNRTLSGWEPLLEQWKCHAQWRNFKHPEQKLSVEISASEVLNLTVTSTLLDLYNMTKDKWAADYYKHTEEAEKGMESLTSVKRRQLLRPYAIRNQTGSLLWFRPVTKTPSQVGGDNLTSQPASQDWVQVPPNEDVSFNFQRHEKIRHKKSQTLRMNQVEVRVDGWQTLNPLSVDKVGTFFRYATPDHEKQTIFVGLDESIELKMDNRVIQGRYETFIINSNQKRPIPISYINSRLWMKPVDWPVDFCSEPISWQHGEKGKIVNHVRTCSSVDSVYRFCVAVFHEHYPEAGQRDVLPGHNILIMAPFTVQNLLPVDLIYYFKGIDISGGIKPGKTTQVHASGLPLVFRQDGCQEAAGQGEETEMARVVSPLLFSFNESNSPYLIYSIGIEVKKGQGSFFRTTIVTFSPRYRIDNLSEHKLAIAQRHFTCKETLTHPDGQLSAPRGSKMPFHWPRQDLDQLLCVRMLDGQTFTIVFLDAEETPPPFRIDNFSEMPLTYYQTKTRDENLRAVIRPNTCLPYAWDEPTLEHYLTLSVPSGSTETYNLDQIGEGTLLCYQSYFFISASATFSRENSFSDAMNSELVFDCEHDFVIFRKKEVGKRSQLWRMTPTNMLENEGMCQPLEPGKASRTGQRYVLDVADNKENPVLVVRKATEGKSARQRWTFREGMLCSESDDDKLMGFVRCVQCPGGIEQLQDGAMVILGMAQVEEGAPIPPHMRMSMQKMNPGSGSLAVRTQMDGPVRVVQINDQQHRFDLNLKGGVGISLVNTVPEELLYISLKNITLNYREGMKAVTFEVTVGNIQADNQLLGAMHTAMLFVTPTSKNDTVDNHHALWISAHRLPNMGWNAEIYKHLLIKMKKMSLQLDEVLLWKLIQYARIDQGRPDADSLNPVADDLNMTLSNAVTLKTKRYYFGILNVKAANELRANALQILGSLDFLGNPAGFIQDVKEGVAGLVHDQNPVGLVKGVMHGISNTSAKMAGVASEALSNIHTDSDHNQKRQVIRAGAKSSGGQFKAGWKGFAHGMVGAFKGIAKPVEGLRKGGIEGFGAGLYQGVTGLVTKPLAGVLDLATGMSNAVKDVSKGSSHKTPDQVRQPRCCHGPGGLLLPFSKNMAKSQQLLYSINESNYQERLIVWDQVRSSSGTEGCYYVSLFRVEERDPYSSNKTPRVRCDCWSTAQKVAQQINYAKSLSEEQKMFVPPLPDIDDQYYSSLKFFIDLKLIISDR